MWWLSILLISFITEVQCGTRHGLHQYQQRTKKPWVPSCYNKWDDIMGIPRALRQIKCHMSFCMGHHTEMFSSTPQDYNSLEGIKDMLDAKHSKRNFYDIHSNVDFIVSRTKPPFADVSDAELKLMKNQFRDINMQLGYIDQVDLRPDQWRELQLQRYGNERKKVKSVRFKWTEWMRTPNDSNPYTTFVDSCARNNVSDLFAAFNDTMNKQTGDLRGFPWNQLEESGRNRTNFTRLAKILKSDMCEATLLMAACDDVLNATDHVKQERLQNDISVYERFADGFRQADKDLVIRARGDIAQTTHYFVGEEMNHSDNTSLAEQIRRRLKESYYWLDFNAVVIETGSALEFVYSWVPILTEYPADEQVSCVITTRPIGDLKKTWKAVVFVSSFRQNRDTNEPTWSAVKQVVDNCSAVKEPCDARKFVVATTAINGGEPVASYIATRKSDINSYTGLGLSGPASLQGNVENLHIYSWIAVLAQLYEKTFFGPVGVIAAAPCGSDIYSYYGDRRNFNFQPYSLGEDSAKHVAGIDLNHQ